MNHGKQRRLAKAARKAKGTGYDLDRHVRDILRHGVRPPRKERRQ